MFLEYVSVSGLNNFLIKPQRLKDLNKYVNIFQKQRFCIFSFLIGTFSTLFLNNVITIILNQWLSQRFTNGMKNHYVGGTFFQAFSILILRGMGVLIPPYFKPVLLILFLFWRTFRKWRLIHNPFITFFIYCLQNFSLIFKGKEKYAIICPIRLKFLSSMSKMLLTLF